MSSSKSFNGVTQAIFDCVKKTSAAQHGTVYSPADADKGTATTDVPVVGTIVMSFDFDPGAETIAYTIQKKPFIVSDSQIFGGIGDTINDCRSK